MIDRSAEEWIKGSRVQTKQPVSYFPNHDSFWERQRVSGIAEMFAMSVRALTGQGEWELQKKVPFRPRPSSPMLSCKPGTMWQRRCWKPVFCHTFNTSCYTSSIWMGPTMETATQNRAKHGNCVDWTRPQEKNEQKSPVCFKQKAFFLRFSIWHFK